MPTPVIEVVLFKLQPGISAEAFLRSAADLDPYIRATPGFMRRELSLGEGGQWVDTVHWQSLEQAQQAAQSIMQTHAQHPFMASIDPQSVTLLHVEPQLSS